MTNEISKCLIWGEDYDAVGYVSQHSLNTVIRESARAGGGYIITDSVPLGFPSLDDAGKARLTTWLVDQRLQGNSRPTVTEEIIEYVVSRSRLPIHERAVRLLRFMSEHTVLAGEPIDLGQNAHLPGIPTSSILLSAMASSEATSPNEVLYLLEHLKVGHDRRSSL